MSDIVVKDFSPQDLQLIKDTVAKGATDAELQLFMYRAKGLGLDPLKPGQIFFVKFGNNAGQIIVGLEGFRALAQRTGKRAGTKRGVTKDDDGNITSAWCEVYRSDWQHPAREEVSLVEYAKPGKNGYKSNWDTMPETMLKKVAECAALRMAFPDELGGVYGEEERQVVEIKEPQKIPMQIEDLTDKPEFETAFDNHYQVDKESPGIYPLDYVFKTGGVKRKGKKVQDISIESIQAFVDWYEVNSKISHMEPPVREDYDAASAYLLSL